MRQTSLPVLAAVFAAAAVSLVTAKDRPLVDTHRSSSISGVVVDELPARSDRDFRLLAALTPGVVTSSVDEVRIDAGKKFASGATPRLTPPGWRCEADGGSLNCTGPAFDPGSANYFAWRLDPGLKLPSRFDLEYRSGGRRVFRDAIDLGLQRGVQVADNIERLLNLPGGVTPGSTFGVSPGSEAYSSGSWSCDFGGQTVDPIDPSTIDYGVALGGPIIKDKLWFFAAPDRVAGDVRPRFRYTDPWGDVTVDAPAPDWFFSSAGDLGCEPARLEACQERIAVGSSICVCGCFPLGVPLDLEVDGKPVPVPLALSTRMVRLELPLIEPGTHVIGWPAVGQSIDFEAVAVRGSIAQDKLKVAQSTDLDFELAGSRQQLPMAINLESGGVHIVGGDRQIAFFNGGDPNAIRRVVKALAVGDFAISYSLGLPPCPCGGYDGNELLDPDFAWHPFETRGRLDTTLLGSGLRYTLPFESDSIMTRTPKPPHRPSEPISIGFTQLGLRSRIAELGRDIRFEQRADLPSTCEFSNVELDTQGRFVRGDARMRLRTEFALPYDEKVPFKVGASYQFSVDDFELGGRGAGVGSWNFQLDEGGASHIRFSDLVKDGAGTTMFGNADFDLRGKVQLKVDF